jgi:SAM-dependent methyltransferase
VLDVGCGPGALTGELVRRVGAECVVAVDPSEPFVEAVRERNPGVDARRAPAEALPFADGAFDAALAQLVVHFMTDPVAGLREMSRVTEPDGVVAACVWDHHGGGSPLSPFWSAVAELEPGADTEAGMAGTRQGHLGELFREAGLAEVDESALEVGVEFDQFDDWWAPFELGVGPAGAYVAGLDDDRREELREHCRTQLGAPPFTVTGRAWAARSGSR